MNAYPLTALATLVIAALMFVLAFNVGKARVKYGVKAPATTGEPTFERIYRVQMNTLESAVCFLPSLWVFAAFMRDSWAALIAAVWIVGRIVYAVTYQRDASKRSAGFAIGALALMVAMLGGVCGVLRALLAAV